MLTDERSREGNEIPKRSSPVRDRVPSYSLCRDCKHILDKCFDIKKEHLFHTSIAECEGFETC